MKGPGTILCQGHGLAFYLAEMQRSVVTALLLFRLRLVMCCYIQKRPPVRGQALHAKAHRKITCPVLLTSRSPCNLTDGHEQQHQIITTASLSSSSSNPRTTPTNSPLPVGRVCVVSNPNPPVHRNIQ